MILKTIKLHFNQPVHFGKKRLGDSAFTIESDTLFSALFIESMKLSLDTDFLLRDLIISDTFPFNGDIYFLPKPMLHVKSENQDLSDKKLFKKLRYIPVEMYREFINGKYTSTDVQRIIENLDIGKSQTITKVALESMEAKEQGNSQPYNIGVHRFSDEAGLYFVAKGNEATLDKLKIVLDSLQYSGIGGKRNSGYGTFTFEVLNDEKMNAIFAQQGVNKILLSTAMARSDENLENILVNASYLLKKRSGFAQSSSYSTQLSKKKDFYSFSSGSVFSKIFEGYIADVSNQGNHPVYRYAKAFWLEV